MQLIGAFLLPVLALCHALRDLNTIASPSVEASLAFDVQQRQPAVSNGLEEPLLSSAVERRAVTFGLAGSQQEHSLQPKTSRSISLRDNRRALALTERGLGKIFQWAGSILHYSPFAFIGGAFNIAGCVMNFLDGASAKGTGVCIAGAALTLIGISYEQWKSAKQGARLLQLEGGAFAQKVANSGPAPAFDMEPTRRKRDLHEKLANHTLGVHHIADDRPVSMLDLVVANITNPLAVYHPKYPVAVHMWSSFENRTIPLSRRSDNDTTVNSTTPVLRIHSAVPLADSQNSSAQTYNMTGKLQQSTMTHINFYPAPGSSPTQRRMTRRDLEISENFDQLQFTDHFQNSVNAGEPSGLYYGYDLYGSNADINEFEADLGTSDDATNGFIDAGLQLGNDYINDNAWDMCVCQQTAETDWVATGSLQLTWDGSYNGYSPCWNADCDDAGTS
jgi:hypothetical protein